LTVTLVVFQRTTVFSLRFFPVSQWTEDNYSHTSRGRCSLDTKDNIYKGIPVVGTLLLVLTEQRSQQFSC